MRAQLVTEYIDMDYGRYGTQAYFIGSYQQFRTGIFEYVEENDEQFPEEFYTHIANEVIKKD